MGSRNLSELHHLERAVLFALKDSKKTTFSQLAVNTELPEASISRATLWLSSKGYVQIEENKLTLIKLGPEGKRFLTNAFPERVLITTLIENGCRLPIDTLSLYLNFSKDDISIALAWAKKKGWLEIIQDGTKTILVAKMKPEKGADEKLLEVVSKGTLIAEDLNPELIEGYNILKKRPNVIQQTEKIERFIYLTKSGLKIAKQILKVAEEISQLSPELIKSGKWRTLQLRKFDIKAPVIQFWPGKKQPFLRFLDEVKWKLMALGFKEMTGPLVEFMFFNCDALYMPQDHPAREIHDIYFVKNPSKGDLSQYMDLVEKVKLSHEKGWKTGSRGWGYSFSVDETKKLVLRSQGTALSARMLVDKRLEIPGKYFSISRCYRPDVVDRTHLTEFNQIEGILLGEKLTFRDLLGVLKKFALDIAKAEKVRFRPDYFPFTEPSVELAAYREGIGWIEFGGAGMFRPEMTLPLGIKVPVIAWGLGVNRLFMMKSGITDIRELFTQNLELLRRWEVI